MKFSRLNVLKCFAMASILACIYTSPVTARDTRISGTVAVVSSSQDIKPFLDKPGPCYVQAYIRFGQDMPDDVVIAVHQEFVEGINNPLYVAGGDWMSFVGIQRSGAVWVGAGTRETLNGNPSTERDWNILYLKNRLQPNQWYRLRVEADFGTRHFKSFTIEGNGINQTFDISRFLLDYPNYMPFDRRAMTYFVSAMRSRNMMTVEGKPIVYFDNIEAGITLSNGTQKKIFFNGFENQSEITSQPLSPLPINPDTYVQGKWYLERSEALIQIKKVSFARSGSFVGFADANLND